MEDRLWKEFIECSCRCHAIGVSYDEDEKEGLPLLDLGFFEHATVGDSRWSMKERIRYAWSILRTGRIYTDQVVLNRGEVQRLKCSLERFLDINYVDVQEAHSEDNNDNTEQLGRPVTFVEGVLDTLSTYWERIFR